ncbi:hydroxyacylglutathione hydrolase [Roseicitreum antarcticum]|uniref:Hydroxyacylglutathione hydrolase n=1 Tax=Roseicitreum antarcticum TaxID=564137 RepID=A0A1H2UPC7_9RHOB|nr:hydroxyacylglutathione hydrolase [Roseicitreum antarcticum]SDW57940.1 hydroxyacylglutathione hydrolase [Roseicitreum antarcticum]
MSLTLLTVPCLKDNYAYLIHDPETKATAVVDVPEAAPVLAALEDAGWRLSDILLTHHHHDHVGGVTEVQAATGARVIGAAADAHRLPPLSLELHPGDAVSVGAEAGVCLDVPGHTVGHLAFHFPQSALAFTGDSLMALGCGRLFEGTPAQMWESLTRLNALPGNTRICSGHDYTAANAAFALTIDPDNTALHDRSAGLDAAHAAGTPMAVCLLQLERDTNPFLRAGKTYIKRLMGLADASDAEVFAEIRARKDRF